MTDHMDPRLFAWINRCTVSFVWTQVKNSSCVAVICTNSHIAMQKHCTEQ